MAVEYEFYLLDDTRGEVPRAQHGRVPGTERRAAGPRVYSLEDLHELDGFFAASHGGLRRAAHARRARSCPSTAPASSR